MLSKKMERAIPSSRIALSFGCVGRVFCSPTVNYDIGKICIKL
jgi:hypothetical protein